MAQQKPQTPKPERRRRRGFERASTLVKGQLRAPAEKRGFAEARLLTHWEEIVGTDVASVALPLKITYGRGFGGTLVLLTTGEGDFWNPLAVFSILSQLEAALTKS